LPRHFPGSRTSADAGQPALAETYATPQREGSNLIDHAGLPSHQAVTHSMQSLQIELMLCLDGHETHVLPFHRFGDRFRIAVVVSVGLYVRAHKLCGNQAHFMPLCAGARPRK